MEGYYFHITGKRLPLVMEMEVQERPLQRNNVLCFILEETSRHSNNTIYKILCHPHPDNRDMFYILIESGSSSQSLLRYVRNFSLAEIRASLVNEKVIPHGAVFIACSSSQI